MHNPSHSLSSISIFSFLESHFSSQIFCFYKPIFMATPEHLQLQQFQSGQKQPSRGPTTSQVIAVITLFPIGGILLTLSGITLAGTVIGLAVTTPLFVIFSPILVPAVIVLGLAVTGFLASGAFGLTALSSLSWMFQYLRGVGSRMPEHMEHAKKRVQDTAGQFGQRTREMGQGKA